MNVGRYAALTALLAGGVCAALPFYKASNARQTQEKSIGQPSERGTSTALVKLEMPHIAVESSGEAGNVVKSPAVAASLQSPGLPEWYQPAPISLASEGTPLPVLPHLPNAQQKPTDAVSQIHEPDFGLTPTTLVPTPAPAPPRRHRIADGDSLSLLALRYLGDQNRGDEIARLNRDVIRDPNLLPVGREILIPRSDTR